MKPVNLMVVVDVKWMEDYERRKRRDGIKYLVENGVGKIL